jgi:hypothetical protein
MSMRVFKEPLLHFVVLGGLLFAVYGWLNNDSGGSSVQQVLINEGKVNWLKHMWVRQWQREPTPHEMRGLLTDFLKEELLYREARAMGLDQDDIIVRRRLAQKMAFLIEDTARFAVPSDYDLRCFYEAHAERFESEPAVSFTHVYFSREARKDVQADARAALARLSRTPAARATETGDPLLIDAKFHDVTKQAVTSVLGPEFTRAVFALKPGAWEGPIASSYGLHLVRILDIKPAQRLEFSKVRGQVLEGWREQQQREHEARYFAALLKKYRVVLDERLKPVLGPSNKLLPTPLIGVSERAGRRSQNLLGCDSRPSQRLRDKAEVLRFGRLAFHSW